MDPPDCFRSFAMPVVECSLLGVLTHRENPTTRHSAGVRRQTRVEGWRPAIPGGKPLSRSRSRSTVTCDTRMRFPAQSLVADSRHWTEQRGRLRVEVAVAATAGEPLFAGLAPVGAKEGKPRRRTTTKIPTMPTAMAKGSEAHRDGQIRPTARPYREGASGDVAIVTHRHEARTAGNQRSSATAAETQQTNRRRAKPSAASGARRPASSLRSCRIRGQTDESDPGRCQQQSRRPTPLWRFATSIERSRESNSAYFTERVHLSRPSIGPRHSSTALKRLRRPFARAQPPPPDPIPGQIRGRVMQSIPPTHTSFPLKALPGDVADVHGLHVPRGNAPHPDNPVTGKTAPFPGGSNHVDGRRQGSLDGQLPRSANVSPTAMPVDLPSPPQPITISSLASGSGSRPCTTIGLSPRKRCS